MVTYNFYEAAMLEGGGFGIWYEYLAKFRIFKKFINSKKVLIFGLPEKYSLALDTLIFAKNSRLDIVETRKEVLEAYKKFAKKFSMKINAFLVRDFTKFKIKRKYNLVISTEVLQNDPSLLKVISRIGKTIIIFVPNKQCYAHPKISKLNSLSLKQLVRLGREQKLKVCEAGYIDCPPWPAGAELESKNNKQQKNQKLYISLAKIILRRVTPIFVKFELFYPSPIKELFSHMVYAIFQNGRV